ncbi:hypothetical protein GQ457_01G055320 [Hibiscus cannabinus]
MYTGRFGCIQECNIGQLVSKKKSFSLNQQTPTIQRGRCSIDVIADKVVGKNRIELVFLARFHLSPN